MAINDVSLTSGMRSNLLSLQNTVQLLDRTQTRLSTGKKVNTAIDNPVSFFASQALNSRASVIDSLKDAMGQAVQTIAAADKGIKAIASMIEQAKGIAQSAQSASATGGYTEAEITFPASLVAGDTIRLGDVIFTATLSATSGTNFQYGIDGPHDAMEFMAAVNAYDWSAESAAFTAERTDNIVTLTKTTTSGGGLDIQAGDIVLNVAMGGALSEIIPAPPSAELVSLETQYNTLLTQLTELAEDSEYKGKNLLSDDDLVVKFEGTTLTVEGFDASAAGLLITDATWTLGGSIDADIVKLDTALVTLRQESSKMSGNLSIITVRQEFSTNMISTLTEGADKLTLADANEEGANMLMLQTRQSLSTSALSMSAQAAQSVLRLFQ